MWDNDIMYDSEKCSATDGIRLAKGLVGKKPPYVIDRRPDGEVVIFSEHFLDAFAKALSHNCIADMTEVEKDLYFEYINYLEYKSESNVLDQGYETQVYAALDEWASDEVFGNPHPEPAVCAE